VDIRFESLRADDLSRLIEWLCSDHWPFHGTEPSPEWVRRRFETGGFLGETAHSFWVMTGSDRLGLARIFDLQDLTPLVDLRVRSPYRGRGIGTRMLNRLIAYAFTDRDRFRLAGYTRADNAAMIWVFEHCGFTKEAHHRKAWPVPGGGFKDSVGYGILREDWKQPASSPAIEMLHIARQRDWEAAQATGMYSLPSSVVHCCLPSQLQMVVDAHFPNLDGWLVLTFEESAIAASIRWVTFTEQARSETFPQVHGAIPLSAVMKVGGLREVLTSVGDRAIGDDHSE
jgi:RimJ/RimL family protein N-acetyltransferase/uncharacterized protein (DUF952 family)